MRVRDQYIPTNGITLHVAETGDPDAPPVVWLHGLWDRWQVWEDVLPRFPGYRHILPELRGHGESDKPEGAAHYRLADYAADIAGVLDALSRTRVAVVGFSLGALTAMALAGREPQRVAAVVLVDPPLRETAEAMPEMVGMREMKGEPPDDIAAMFAFLQPSRTEAEQRWSAEWLRTTADGPFDALIAGTYGPYTLPALCGAIMQPALLLHADAATGGALPDEIAARAMRFLPHAELVQFPGSGHNIMHDQPNAFVAAVAPFLANSHAPERS